jgi:hypothetical protein
MLADFIDFHRPQIIDRCRRKVAERLAPPPTTVEINHGVPMFLDDLTAELRSELSANADLAATATKHGQDLFERGFTPSQVVHDYGDICQTITEMVIETQEPISADDFRTLNGCLDNAIASAITEYERARDASTRVKSAQETNRVRVLGNALRVSVQVARVAFDAIQSGKVGMSGSTGMVLTRNLQGIEDLNERLQVEISDPAKLS